MKIYRNIYYRVVATEDRADMAACVKCAINKYDRDA